MRKKLGQKLNERELFSGIFSRYGNKTGFTGKLLKTVLLENITDNKGEVLCDHLWFNLTKGFKLLGELKYGDKIEFEARVKPYKKGYRGHRIDNDRPPMIDYHLTRPSKFNLILPIDKSDKV